MKDWTGKLVVGLITLMLIGAYTYTEKLHAEDTERDKAQQALLDRLIDKEQLDESRKCMELEAKEERLQCLDTVYAPEGSR